MSFDDIIPIDALFGKKAEPKYEGNSSLNNGKKENRPGSNAVCQLCEYKNMDVRVARDLIDIGIREIYELEGRSAESIFDEIKDLRPETLLAWPI